MKIYEVHQENWNDVKNFLGLDCKAPHLEIGIDYFSLNNSCLSTINRFLGVGGSVSVVTPAYNFVLGGPMEKIEAMTFKFITLYDGPVVIGGVGLTKKSLKNEKKARLLDKFEQIHCALAYSSPFYTMRLDPLAHPTGRIMYKSFEEDIAWALLKQIEGTDEIIDFRQKILNEVGLSQNDARKAMIDAEETLRKVDTIKEPVKAFKEYMKISEIEDGIKEQDINAEDDYKNFISMGYKFIRFLDSEFQYFQPKFI